MNQFGKEVKFVEYEAAPDRSGLVLSVGLFIVALIGGAIWIAL